MIRSGRNPFEVFLLGISTLLGLVGVLPGPQPSSAVVDGMPPLAQLAWWIALAGFGGAGSIGVWLPLPRCLVVEAVALVGLGSVLLGYAAVLAWPGGGRSVSVAGLITAAFGAACLARAASAARDLRRLGEQVHRIATGDP